MKWRGRRQSDNVIDSRGSRAPAVVGGGIGMILLALFVGLMGGDPRQVMQQAQGPAADGGGGGGVATELSELDIERGEFVATILADTEDVWTKLFADMGRRYQTPQLELFTQAVNTACGSATSASGPFYCPADQKVYLDTAFFDQMDKQLGAPGDFAQAYVVAHEVGHHVQNLFGTTAKLDQARRTLPKEQYNQLSVRLELQADFFAGVVFHHSQRDKRILEEGDIEEGLRAAAAIGDDTLQKRSQGYAKQETFTHGSSQQRVQWFMKGLETGDPEQGDTFAAGAL